MAKTLSPHAMLSCPRPSTAIPSPSGLHFAQISSSFDFRSRRTTKHAYVTAVDSKETRMVVQDLRYGEVAWLDDHHLLLLRRGSDVDASLTDAQQRARWSKEDEEDVRLVAKHIDTLDEHTVGTLPLDTIGDLKIHHVSAHEAVLAFSASVYGPERTVYTARQRQKEIEEALEGSDVRVYDQLFIRHWDEWCVPNTSILPGI
jgi:dipeptidyl aminopeptidase/acylaminoacyl peptidase